MLLSSYTHSMVEAGCDEAGRGALAGPVFAAAVILPENYSHPFLNDSKKLTAKLRDELRDVIEKEALAFAVASIDHHTIDQINILNASFLAMHHALDQLQITPELILIDGNRFHPFRNIRHQCITGGDGKYLSIAAASVLAKTYRDDFMRKIHVDFPQYGWGKNKGYATYDHRNAVYKYGESPWHRKSFHLSGQLKIKFE